MAGNTIKITKLAIGNTNIGGIYIPVYYPGYFSMGTCFFLNSSATNISSANGSIFKQKNAFFNRKKFKIQALFV